VKRYLIPALILLCVLSLIVWGDRILGRVLNDHLPPLLTRELGLPVHIAPIEANILSLTAKTSRLVMGKPEDPAVVAQDVVVSLDWSDLLRFEIRLINASAADLSLQLSNWPGNDDPWPTDYLFLDPWLPQQIYLEKGRYLDSSGEAYSVHAARWQRRDEGASVAWRGDHPGGEIHLAAVLDSLDNLMKLQPIALDISINNADAAQSTITLNSRFSPRNKGGYDLDLALDAPGAKARIITGNPQSWQFPDRSQIAVTTLRIDRLLELARTYRAQPPRPQDATAIEADLPELALPEHVGAVTIDQLWYQDELGKDTSFEFSAGSSGLRVTDLSSAGPQGHLQGSFALQTDDRGWKVDLNATLEATDSDKTLAPEYLEADWIWQKGHARLHGQGARWDALLGSLQGDINLVGYHRGERNTPVSMSALLDNTSEDLALEQLAVTLGEGRISGSASLTGGRLLTLTLEGEELDLDFLFEEGSENPQPGITIPEYLGLLPGIDIKGRMKINELTTPVLQLATAEVDLDRSAAGGILSMDASGVHAGRLQLEMKVDASDGESRKIDLSMQLDDIDLAQLFQQDMRLYSRTTGTIDVSGVGKGLNAIFNSMRGSARLTTDFRRDDNWQRDQRGEERLDIAADAALVIDGTQIVGLQLDNLKIDSIEQDVTGSLSMRADTSPWLSLDLEAQKIDIDDLIALFPESSEQADRADLLSFVRELGAARISLEAQSIRFQQQLFSALKIEVTSAENSFNVGQLDFMFEGNPLTSSGSLTWKDQTATLQAEAQILDFNLDQFLIQAKRTDSIPVSGTARLRSEGDNFAQLFENLSGTISLMGALQGPDVPVDKRRRVEISAKRVENGMHADVSEFLWGQNSLKGNVRYQQGETPSFDVIIEEGSVDLTPWEKSLAGKESAKTAEKGSLVGATARNSAKLIGDILRSPALLFSGPSQAEAGQKLFDDDPLPLSALQGYLAKVRGNLSEVRSSSGNVSNLTLDGSLVNGMVKLDAKADRFNGGPGKLNFEMDTLASPPSFNLSIDFSEIRRADDQPTFPRSGLFNLSSRGNTTAELAANLNGQLYLELGKGPFDYTNVSLFTSDVAYQITTALIPGVEKSKPQLQCGVMLMIIEDGIGKTPVGYTLRTDRANLLGRLKIDLKKEEMELALDSRSREGVGLAVGNVFSNTIRVKGPLSNPQIVPHATGILWRGWAAFMTAGLSVVGESVLKRAMAADNPCNSIRQDIRNQVCGTDHPLARSPLVCN
jgi:uncharacterized protein involved in outer membrane biogenesis